MGETPWRFESSPAHHLIDVQTTASSGAVVCVSGSLRQFAVDRPTDVRLPRAAAGDRLDAAHPSGRRGGKFVLLHHQLLEDGLIHHAPGARAGQAVGHPGLLQERQRLVQRRQDLLTVSLSGLDPLLDLGALAAYAGLLNSQYVIVDEVAGLA